MKKSDRTSYLFARITPTTKKLLKKYRPKDVGSEAEYVEMILQNYLFSVGKWGKNLQSVSKTG